MNERLFIECPTSGQPIFTGIATNRGNTIANNSIGCPICGQMHMWSAEDAFYMDENGNRDPYIREQ